MADLETVDATGLSCPQPALMTKRAVSRRTSGLIEVLVDTATSRDNVARIAQNAGWVVTVEERVGGFRVVLAK